MKAILPYMVELFVFCFIWTSIGRAFAHSGIDVHPAYWMLLGYFAGNLGMWISAKAKDQTTRMIGAEK
jgi:hypothetical protein